MRAFLFLLALAMIFATVMIVLALWPRWRKQQAKSLRHNSVLLGSTLQRIEDHMEQALMTNPDDVLGQQIQFELQQLRKELEQ